MTKKKDGPKSKGGRPCSYKSEFAEQAKKLCLLFHQTTDEDIAKFLGKNVDTIYEWKKKFPEFSEAIRAGKVEADTEIAMSLFNRARGAEWIEDQAFKVKETIYADNGRKLKEIERIEVVQVRRAAPPDTPAIGLWLWNRQATAWRRNPEPGEGDEVTPVKVEIAVVDARKPERADP
ncbi:helix-turn-helix domain-containing protein [Methylobacterium oryzae]|uniref:helix-turn-helix domain-containing protein n=1 Tax=Methylobacterium oryzae TaxID=334852 RepID=UPI002F311859